MAIQYVGGQGAGFAGKTSATTVTFSLTDGLAVVMRAGKSKSWSVVGTLSHTGTQDWKRWRPEIAIRKEW